MENDVKLDVVSGIDEKIIDRNTQKRAELWHKTLQNKSGKAAMRAIIILAAALALSLTALIAFMVTDRSAPPIGGTEAETDRLPIGDEPTLWDIVSIERISTEQKVSTYKITYGSGDISELKVSNRAPDNSGAAVNNITYNDQNEVFMVLATGKLVNMGTGVGRMVTGSESADVGSKVGVTYLSYSSPSLEYLTDRTDILNVTEIKVDKDETTSYKLGNDKEISLGKIHKKHEGGDGQSLSMALINDSGELVLGFESGESINLGRVVGKDGKDGVGISGIELSDAGELSVAMTNGTVINLGNIKGADGVGIAESKINDDGELVLTYTDGNTVNVGRVVGEKGETGTGIASITIDESGNLVIVLTDGTELNLGNVKGENGKSAYELYKEKYGYEGSEEDWLYDLVNGKLALKAKFTVTFDTVYDDATAISAQEVAEGGKVVEPEAPTLYGSVFLGWYYNDEPWSFAGYSVTEDITLVARWRLIEYTPWCSLGEVSEQYLVPGTNVYMTHAYMPENPERYNMLEDGSVILKNPHAYGKIFTGWTYPGQDEPVLILDLKDVFLEDVYYGGVPTFCANWKDITEPLATHSLFDKFEVMKFKEKNGDCYHFDSEFDCEIYTVAEGKVLLRDDERLIVSIGDTGYCIIYYLDNIQLWNNDIKKGDEVGEYEPLAYFFGGETYPYLDMRISFAYIFEPSMYDDNQVEDELTKCRIKYVNPEIIFSQDVLDIMGIK